MKDKNKMTATAWAAETYGFNEWCPQSASEFIEHCNTCGLKIDVDVDDEGEPVLVAASTENVREAGGKIWVKHAARHNETGWAPQMGSDNEALVAEVK